jgi:hypothetical protein
MKYCRVRAVGVVLLLFAAVLPAAAQRTTGAIFGTVTDESGAVLPGVTVTLQGPAVPGTRCRWPSGRKPT